MKHWQLKRSKAESDSSEAFPYLPRAISAVLLARGFDSEDSLQCFLNPPHRLPHCPMRLSGMEAAIQRLQQAMPAAIPAAGPAQSAGERVGIVGDFDVDGITGTAVLVEGLSGLGIEAIPYVPHRVSEGHGLSGESVNYLARRGVSLIITVDCGVSSVEEAALARQMGIDVIVTDHHVPPAEPPEVVAIINPGMPGNEYPFQHLCGAGLAFKLVQGLYKIQGKPLPEPLLELVALGTIADVVPLVDENRYLVKQGLERLGKTERPGLTELYRSSGLTGKPITTESVAFQIAPRLNSAGRMGHAEDSLRLLITRDPDEAATLAQQLESQNRERQELTRQLDSLATSYVESLEELPPFIVFTNPMLTPGIAGLVASRLAERYHRPSVALAPLENGTYLASGRSIPSFNLIGAFNSCSGLFVRHGGHAQAAGFTLAGENLPELERRLNELALSGQAGANLDQSVDIDAAVGLGDISEGLLHWLDRLEPFGEGNPRPTFLTEDLEVKQTWKMGTQGQHLKLLVTDGRRSMPVLAFNRADEWPENARKIDLVYSVEVDYWRGKKQINLLAVDFRPADVEPRK